jgi:hypothetical protein
MNLDEFFDVIFEIDENDNEQLISKDFYNNIIDSQKAYTKGNSIVLAARCDYFRALFEQ